MAYQHWPASEPELAQMRRFNQKLAWTPRFKIRNRVTPRLIQALLRAQPDVQEGACGGAEKGRQGARAYPAPQR